MEWSFGDRRPHYHNSTENEPEPISFLRLCVSVSRQLIETMFSFSWANKKIMYRLAIDCPAATIRNNLHSFDMGFCVSVLLSARFPSRFSTIFRKIEWPKGRENGKRDPHKNIIDHFRALMRYSVWRDSRRQTEKKRENGKGHSFLCRSVRSSDDSSSDGRDMKSLFHIFCSLSLSPFTVPLRFGDFFFLYPHTLVIVRKCFKYLLIFFFCFFAIYSLTLVVRRPFWYLLCLFIYFCYDQIFVIHFIGWIKRDGMHAYCCHGSSRENNTIRNETMERKKKTII